MAVCTPRGRASCICTCICICIPFVHMHTANTDTPSAIGRFHHVKIREKDASALHDLKRNGRRNHYAATKTLETTTIDPF